VVGEARGSIFQGATKGLTLKNSSTSEKRGELAVLYIRRVENSFQPDHVPRKKFSLACKEEKGMWGLGSL